MGLQRVGHSEATLTFIFHPSGEGLYHKDSDSPHATEASTEVYVSMRDILLYARNFHGLCDMVEHFKNITK